MKLNFKYSNISKYRGMLMGIAAISIILFHFSNECKAANLHYYPWNEFILNFISSSGVDIFLILSGYGLYYSFKKNNNVKKFYKKRFIKILIPYIIFCLPAIIIRYIFMEGGTLIDVFKNYLFITLFSEGETWFWYILLIMICYTIFPYIYNSIEKPKKDVDKNMNFMMLISFTILLNILLATNNLNLFQNINILTLRIPIFILGVYIGQQSYQKKELNIIQVLALIVCSTILYPAINSAITLRRYEFALIAIITYIILIIIFNIIDKYQIFQKLKLILEKVGSYSLELYLTHVCIISIINHTGNTTAAYKYFIIEIIFTIVASFIIKKLADIISNKIKKIGW